MNNMCLGWYNRPTCSARRPIDLTSNPAIDPANPTCPDISWFWLGAAAIIVAGFMKSN